MVRLFRGEGEGSSGGQWFTPNERLARLYAKDRPNSYMLEVEVPRSELSKYAPKNPEYIVPKGKELELGEYLLPDEIAKLARRR